VTIHEPVIALRGEPSRDDANNQMIGDHATPSITVRPVFMNRCLEALSGKSFMLY
jgi:hypothetical protein